MLLDDLVSVIETLQQRIRDHGDTLRQNEYRTRMALIDPLLTALGWDVSDPGLVTPEYRVDVGWADYALRGQGVNPAAVVEAKRLGSFVENHLTQVVGYCIEQGIAYAAVTDGNHWQLYRTFDQVPMEQKRILGLHVNDTLPHESALQFLLLWRPNLSTAKAMPANEPLLLGEELLSLSGKQPSNPSMGNLPDPETGNPPIPQIGWSTLATFNAETGTKPPGAIRFPDTTQKNITIWRHVEERTIEWLWEKGWLNPSNLPVRSSNQRYIVNTTALHPTGNPFAFAVQVNGTPLVLEGNISSVASTNNAKTLLNHCGLDLSSVWVKVS